jgi:riboflavin transporter FmnP
VKQGSVRTLTLSGLFIALGLLLPFLTGQIPALGNLLLPMHIPVLLCGFFCGGPAGLAVGLITPILRSLLFGMPPMLPIAVAMAFELATYGFVTGLLYNRLPRKLPYLYASLIVAMIFGRVVWGLASYLIFSLSGSQFTWQIFLGGALLNAIPGIILQLVLIPPLVKAFEKATRHPGQVSTQA